ncbi:MAG: glyoxalase [Deltaproteobacteria bacterium]|nr:MAG: glyoxalase [Deltaproteobacteria bacterium]
MRIRALQHVSIRSRDLARARDFYERLLGLPAVPRPELGFPGAWYGIGTNQLHLIAHEKLMEGIDPTDPHFALEVESLEAVRRELQTSGIPYLDFGGPQLWVRDPDGNVVELCEPSSV